MVQMIWITKAYLILITYDLGRLAAGNESGLIPNEANWADGIALTIDESVVDANKVEITDALFEFAIFNHWILELREQF